VRIAVAASPEVAIPTLIALVNSPHVLVRVISQPDRPAGRGKVMTATPVSQWAIANKVELLRPESTADIADAVRDLDCVITIGYGVLLPESILEIPRYGFLNLHFSLLPRWRGAAPVQRAIEAQDSVTGVTVFQLDAGMDTGPIYTVHRFALDSDITSDELLVELGEVGVGAVLESLDKISRGERPVPQSSEGATRAFKLSREEARIDWSLDAETVSAKIRAFTSNPGAWTQFRGSVIKIAAPVLSTFSLEPGEIALRDRKVFIGTGTSALEIGAITSAGKGSIAASSWANGARLLEGERCE
jgi:methionyl-tRNA formyltransferase